MTAERAASFDPTRPEFAPYGLTCVRWSPTRMNRADRHNEIELNCLHAGSLTYLFGGQKMRLKAGDLGAFWAAIPHQIVAYERRTEYHVVTIPLGWFLTCKAPQDFVQGLMQGRFCHRSDRRQLVRQQLTFTGWAQDLKSNDATLRQSVLLEIEACLLRLAASLAGPVGSPGTPRNLSKAERMAGMIAMSYTEPLTTKDIADAVGLHPNYAMQVFHRAFGDTLVGYVTRHRISHAQRLLVTTNQKIVDVAIASGFGSLSRFNDAFRQSCGCSPRYYRHNLPSPTDWSARKR